jgi:beta-lactamase class A
MNKKSKVDLEKDKIYRLESKLKQAEKVISQLQRQNIELKKPVIKSQNSRTQKPTEIASMTANSGDGRRFQVQNQQNKSSPGKSMPKYPLTKLSHLKFYALTGSIVLFIVSLLVLGNFFSHRGKQNDRTTKSQITKNQSTPLPQTIPSIAQPNSSPIRINTPIQSQPILSIDSNAQLGQNNLDFVYNVTTPPTFNQDDKKLKKIVDRLVKYARDNQLPVDSLSISLIDLNNKTTSFYQEEIPRYPASVVKLFWMVALEAKIKQGTLSVFPSSINADLNTMMLKSDNDAASNVVDAITGTISSNKTLDKQEFSQWKEQRQKLNNFYQEAGYKNINISQKTYPLPLHNISEPQGADQQIRGDNPSKPQRNKITTSHAARLMYEIVNGEAVAPDSQEKMLGLLNRDLSFWQSQPPNPEEFNPVQDLFGESLPAEVEFYSKAGWTTTSRQEVAYVKTKNTRYILAIFGDDRAYASSKKAFPKMSRIVFDGMIN